MAKLNVIWLGDADPHAQTITEGGITFVKGEAVKVPDNHPWVSNFQGNPTFSVDEDASPEDAGEEEEIASIKEQLDQNGVRYRANASLSSLRTLLAQNTGTGDVNEGGEDLSLQAGN